MMATVLHNTSGLGLIKFQADGFCSTVYKVCKSGREKENFRSLISINIFRPTLLTT